jgi:dipeptidyl aminopeptidase/acylaminoacyl peptidase
MRRLLLWVVLLAVFLAAMLPPGMARAQATFARTAKMAQPAMDDPYADLYIESLRARGYGGGSINMLKTLAVTPAFTRTLISYPSDGLNLQGFMNVPRGRGNGPFPVVLVLHGYVTPSTYRTLAYTTRYADALARAGFLVIHPDYRGHGDSEDGLNMFRTGYAVDVLNLIALVKQLPQAKADAIGLVGHSMGGGIALRVITVNKDVKAAVLYGSMSGDEDANFERIQHWRGGARSPEQDVPAEIIARISPINYLADVQAAVSIHHGARDDSVPPAWSVDLRERLVALDKPLEYFNYPGQPHTFIGNGDALFIRRMTAFLNKRLK